MSPALVADSLRFSAGGALTWPSQALTLSVVRRCVARTSSPDSARLSTTNRSAEPNSSEPGPCCYVSRWGYRAAQPRVPLIGLTLPFGKIDRIGDDVRTRATDRAPFSQFPEARPSQGCELSSPAIPEALSSVVTLPVHRARCLAPISAADLFSRAPARTRHSQASGSHPLDRNFLPRASNRVGARSCSRIRLLRRQRTIAGPSSLR